MSSYAIVVGINDYTPEDDEGLRTLNGAISDAESFKRWVTTTGRVDDKNCHLITSTKKPLTPVKDMIDDAIQKINQTVINEDNNDADRLYFYFAGHGLGVEDDKENSGLCMANWEEGNCDARALASEEYRRKFLNEGLFKEVVIILDCCRNPKVYFHPAGSGSIKPRLGPNNNTRWMVAYGTQSGNETYEFSVGDGETRGIFTKVLLEGLNGGASKDGKTISAKDIADYLEFNLLLAAKEAGYAQEPEILGNIISTKYPFYFKQ